MCVMKSIKKNPQTKQKQYFYDGAETCIGTPIRYTYNGIQFIMKFITLLRWDKILIKKNVLYDRGNK